MSTKYPDIFAALSAPFRPNEVRMRKQGGRDLHYITARVAMNRLDSVLGPESWSDEYRETKEGLMCIITVRLPDGTVVTKCDGGAAAGMPEADNDEKSAFSDAFKRACVKLGVARYLYCDGTPDFANEPGHAQDLPMGQAANGNGYHPPRDLPRQFERTNGPPPSQGQPDRTQNGDRKYDGPPRSGKGLFAWVKEMEQKHDIQLLLYINKWAKLVEFPGRMIDWDADQVKQAYEEATRKLNAVGAGASQDHEPGHDG